MTDQDAIIPAAAYPTFGQATVSAQTVLIGAAANSKAGTIYGPCCRLNISAVSSAFTGGQDGRDYRTVNQQDITTTANTLKTSLATSARAALQTQVQNGESLFTPFACASQVSTDHQPGDEAAQVTITMSETCHALAYHAEALHDVISHAINQQAATSLGGSYTPTSDLALSIKDAQMNDQGTATIQVVGTQTYGYQFSQQEQQQLKNRIAGKGKDEATTLLLHTPGVQTVSINDDPIMVSIPTDTSRIHILFLIGYVILPVWMTQ